MIRKWELINTIEILPYYFAIHEYDSPQKSLAEAPEEWQQFWIKCISESGLGNLRNIEKGSYLVDVENIEIPELEIIIKKELEDVEIEEFEDQIGKLCGGIVLKYNDEIRIQPRCCGDLENLNNWEQIFQNESENWKDLWIGHPWIYYKKNNGIVEFSDDTETSLELENIEALFSVSEADLKKGIEKIRHQQNKLQEKIQKILLKNNYSNAERIAQLLTGNA